eukprot:790401_1
MFGTSFQYLIICFIAIILLYYILDEHIAKNLDDNPLIQSPTMMISSSYPIDCNNHSNNKHHPHQLYFANEIALHTELIGYSYANEIEIRKANFMSEMELFTTIGRDLLQGNTHKFKHLSRYYVHPSKYHEYTREYMLNKWINERKNHINPKDLIGAHPSCPKWDKNIDINTYEIHFSHKCCKKYGPAHKRTTKDTGNFDYVLHYEKHNISQIFKQKNEDIIEYWRGVGYWLWTVFICVCVFVLYFLVIC